MPHLLNVWASAGRIIRDAPRVLLVSDFDGTLAPIVDRPDQAALPAETKETLIKLVCRDKYVLGIVSGRSLDDVSSRIGIPGLFYAGNHGLEIKGPGMSFVHPEAGAFRQILQEAYLRLRQELGEIPGVIVEQKGLTLSVHHRLTPDGLVGEVQTRFAEAMAPFLEPGKLKITRGKKVLEVRPHLDWDKGKAIIKLREAYPETSLTVFFGDDLTDEDGFSVVQDSGGLAVFVGPAREPTCALHWLDSPEEVAETLKLMLEL